MNDVITFDSIPANWKDTDTCFMDWSPRLNAYVIYDKVEGNWDHLGIALYDGVNGKSIKKRVGKKWVPMTVSELRPVWRVRHINKSKKVEVKASNF